MQNVWLGLAAVTLFALGYAFGYYHGYKLAFGYAQRMTAELVQDYVALLRRMKDKPGCID